MKKCILLSWITFATCPPLGTALILTNRGFLKKLSWLNYIAGTLIALVWTASLWILVPLPEIIGVTWFISLVFIVAHLQLRQSLEQVNEQTQKARVILHNLLQREQTYEAKNHGTLFCASQVLEYLLTPMMCRIKEPSTFIYQRFQIYRNDDWYSFFLMRETIFIVGFLLLSNDSEQVINQFKIVHLNGKLDRIEYDHNANLTKELKKQPNLAFSEAPFFATLHQVQAKENTP